MKRSKDLVLRKDDHDLLLSYLKGAQWTTTFDQTNAHSLEEELKKAKLVSKKSFPSDVVRLNSKVKILDAARRKEMELTLVIPEKADVKQGKISIMAPIGTALIGFRKGQEVEWKVPSGQKTFKIIDVYNAAE